MEEKELKWHKRYIDLAEHISNWSSCLRRKVGAVVTYERRVVGTGYNGAPAGVPSCKELNRCLRKDAKSGENLNECVACHAEVNAISQCCKYGQTTKGAYIYITTYPCINCMKLIIASGIKKVFYKEEYNSPLTQELADQANIELIQIK